jgi:transposase-like protein
MASGELMSKKILKQKPQRTEEVRKWIAEEVAEQLDRYAVIANEMNVVIEPQREQWYREFEARIQATGFNWHADTKRIIKPDEIYPKPDRENKVVY